MIIIVDNQFLTSCYIKDTEGIYQPKVRASDSVTPYCIHNYDGACFKRDAQKKNTTPPKKKGLFFWV